MWTPWQAPSTRGCKRAVRCSRPRRERTRLRGNFSRCRHERAHHALEKLPHPQSVRSRERHGLHRHPFDPNPRQITLVYLPNDYFASKSTANPRRHVAAPSAPPSPRTAERAFIRGVPNRAKELYALYVCGDSRQSSDKGEKKADKRSVATLTTKPGKCRFPSRAPRANVVSENGCWAMWRLQS